MFTTLFVKTQIALEKYKNDEQGVTAIEYGLIAAAVAVVVGAAFGGTGGIGESLKTIFNSIITALGGTTVT